MTKITPLKKQHLNILYKTIKKHEAINFIWGIKSYSDLSEWLVKLDDDEAWLVAKLGSKVIGFISFVGDEENKEVQIFLVPKYQQQGLGNIILAMGEKWIRDEYPNLKEIRADIFFTNESSIFLFKNSGYRQEGDCGDWCKKWRSDNQQLKAKNKN